MMKKLLITSVICFILVSCGSGGGGSDPAANNNTNTPTTNTSVVFPESSNGNMTIVSISNELFENLSTLAAKASIPVTATDVNGNVKIAVTSVTSVDLQTPAILRKHPNGTAKGEICIYRNQDVINTTGTGEINLSVTGVIEGDYVIKECSVELAIATTNTEWDAITSQAFGPAQAFTVFFDRTLISRHIVEDTALLYTGSFASDIVNNFSSALFKVPVLANESKGIVCMNVSLIVPEYVSYFTPKIVVDSTPPAGYTTTGLSDVNRPVAFVPNCTFDQTVWQGIWDNN